MHNYELPHSDKLLYIEYLACVHDTTPLEATAAHKFGWLATLTIREPALTYEAFYLRGRALKSMGPFGEECEEQDRLVRAFVRELKTSRCFATPPISSPAMPTQVFKKLIAWRKEIRTGSHSKDVRQRFTSAFMLVWATGVYAEELRLMRPRWLEKKPKGYLLHVQSERMHRIRTIPIPYVDDPLLSAASELDAYLKLVPPSNTTYLYPRVNERGDFCWNEPARRTCFSEEMLRMPRWDNVTGYNMLSIRRSFLQRCMEKLGPALTFYFSGFASLQALFKTLQSEPHWAQGPSVLESLEM